jgi:hypothetical protein
MKSLTLGVVFAMALSATAAFASQNVANTSQKGSLLIFPAIVAAPSGLGGLDETVTTQVDISNDQNLPVHVECYYVNQNKGRRDFDFFLSPKQTVSWDVLSQTGDIVPAQFPSTSYINLGNPDFGELICFAVDTASSTQVRFNHLTGTATIVVFNSYPMAFKYNAWAFTARSNDVTPPPDLSPVGTPGELLLTGAGDGTYDACPQYLIGNFSPDGATVPNPALAPLRTDTVTYNDNVLAVSGCNQDLRQDFKYHFTKLYFNIWNALENSFSGTYICSDSTALFDLSPAHRLMSPSPNLPQTGLENFTYDVLRTDNARFQVQGIKSGVCFPPAASLGTEADGLLAVLASDVTTSTASPTVGAAEVLSKSDDTIIGNTLQGAGAENGFVLWDPQSATVPEATKKK